jgi:hypothetical protein
VTQACNLIEAFDRDGGHDLARFGGSTIVRPARLFDQPTRRDPDTTRQLMTANSAALIAEALAPPAACSSRAPSGPGGPRRSRRSYHPALRRRRAPSYGSRRSRTTESFGDERVFRSQAGVRRELEQLGTWGTDRGRPLEALGPAMTNRNTGRKRRARPVYRTPARNSPAPNTAGAKAVSPISSRLSSEQIRRPSSQRCCMPTAAEGGSPCPSRQLGGRWKH